MNASELYQAGQLTEAVAAAIEAVKQNPTDPAKRGLLCELLCFAGDWERADKHLDTLGTQDPKLIVTLALVRQLIRAEQARQQLYSDGRVPEFLVPPSDQIQLYLRALVELREGRGVEAGQLLADAESQRPKSSGTCNGQPFDDWRDLDDVSAAVLEVLTSNGKFYWVPVTHIESLEFHAPERPRDLIWRRCHMIVRGGPDGEVFIPALYPGTYANSDSQLRLGRGTDWLGGDAGPSRGVGRRMFLVGDESLDIMQLKTVEFAEGS